MKIIICALLLLTIGENVNGKPILGSVVDTIHNIGCKIHNDGSCRPQSQSSEQNQVQKTSFLGTVKEKVHGAVHKLGCAIKTHEGCLEPTTEASDGRIDISSLIDIRIDEDNATSAANNENVVFSSSDETENKSAPKAIITVPHNCPTGFRLDRQNRCRQIE